LAANTKERSLYREQLKSFGIPTEVYYNKPLHLQDAFKNVGYNEGDFPVSESISKRIFSMPMHPYLADDDVKQICEILLSIKEKV
jgi:dTDP-4-amino-4,6-dideoxygalactose transaminase